MLRLFILFTLLVGSQAIAKESEKLVVAGGTLTELVFALGAGDQVVAVDQSSLYPANVSELPSVGYYRDLAAEGVLSTGLTRLIAQEGSGRDAALKQIEAAGVQVNYYEKTVTVEGLFRLIEKLGQDLSKGHRAKQ